MFLVQNLEGALNQAVVRTFTCYTAYVQTFTIASIVWVIEIFSGRLRETFIRIFYLLEFIRILIRILEFEM